MLKRLRLKFVLVNMTIVISMLLVIFSMVYHTTQTDLERQRETELKSILQETTQPGREPRSSLPYFVICVNNRGTVTASGVTSYDLSDTELLENLLKVVLGSNATMGLLPYYHLQFYQISYMGEKYIAFVDTSSHDAMLQSLIETCILIGGISMLAFLLISLLLARWAVKPVEEAWKRQKQFVSDASHELKTPLTVIMSNAELLQSPEIPDKTAYADNILTMSRQMRSLVEGMLDLARSDGGKLQQAFERVDFSKLTEDALLPFEPVFYEKGLMLESHVERKIHVMGNRQYLQQVVDILLDNAGKYAEPGIVGVELCLEGKHCVLTVSNPGQPIPREDLQRIFERFYRADTARTGTGSFGLGLSIAKSVVEAHGGTIWAESNETGNAFHVRLPMN